MSSELQSIVKVISTGLSVYDKGRPLREALLVYLSEMDKPMTIAVRAECSRLLAEALQMAHAIGSR